jgi:hypothetical protein
VTKGIRRPYPVFPSEWFEVVRFEVVDTGYETPCHIWAMNTRNGYGQVKFQGRGLQAHIVYYEHEHGPVPEGLQLDHLCSVRPCVRGSHLEPVTGVVNIRRGSWPKLTLEDARKIRSDPRSNRVVAREYNVSHGTIWNIRVGRTWRGEG